MGLRSSKSCGGLAFCLPFQSLLDCGELVVIVDFSDR